MTAATLTVAVSLAVNSVAQTGTMQADERDYQSENFRRWWDTELVWRFDDLPTEGAVPRFRRPYSGHDYPDRAGGTMVALRKYDLAFHNGRQLATSWERTDVGADRPQRFQRAGPTWVRGRGLFRNVFAARPARAARQPTVPGWHGHCNGWTAAAIRHAEPEYSVRRNGVVFRPADIKGLLAEIYMYAHAEFLGGVDHAINPGTFHAVLANWLGRGSHPVAMESTLGPEKWNYPMYAFNTSFAKRGDDRVEVKMNVAYTMSTNREYDRARHIRRIKYFHYDLDLDAEGRITGGTYHRDSSRVDMLWAPLHPVPAGAEGNERGNPHVDIDEVLAIWRASVPEETRQKWFNIDPTEEDRILVVDEDPEEVVAEERGTP